MIPKTDSKNWFHKLIPRTDSKNWFQKLIPKINSNESKNWFQKLIPKTNYVNWFQKLISMILKTDFDDSKHWLQWFQKLILTTNSTKRFQKSAYKYCLHYKHWFQKLLAKIACNTKFAFQNCCNYLQILQNITYSRSWISLNLVQFKENGTYLLLRLPLLDRI